MKKIMLVLSLLFQVLPPAFAWDATELRYICEFEKAPMARTLYLYDRRRTDSANIPLLEDIKTNNLTGEASITHLRVYGSWLDHDDSNYIHFGLATDQDYFQFELWDAKIWSQVQDRNGTRLQHFDWWLSDFNHDRSRELVVNAANLETDSRVRFGDQTLAVRCKLPDIAEK